MPAKVIVALGLEEKARRRWHNRLAEYRPYQKQREFHKAGASPKIRERLLIAGNQLGKTWSAGFEMAMHLTGRYPGRWDGAVFDTGIAWAPGVTGEVTRDSVRVLCGQINAIGTGAIPGDATKDKAMKRPQAPARRGRQRDGPYLRLVVTLSELLDRLERYRPHGQACPRSPKGLGHALRRLAPGCV